MLKESSTNFGPLFADSEAQKIKWTGNIPHITEIVNDYNILRG
jgi:hypothetical protein